MSENMDWADKIVHKVNKNVHKGLLKHYSNTDYIQGLMTGTHKPKSIPSRIAIVTVLETILEDFPNLDHDFNEGMLEMIKQIKERGNL